MKMVRDSSMVKAATPAKSMVNRTYGSLHMGIIRGLAGDTFPSVNMYEVEVVIDGRRTIMACRQLSKFGDPFNYEEWSLRANRLDMSPMPASFNNRAGEVVIVAPLDGNYTSGIIIGAIMHPSKKQKINPKEGIAYASEFNGLETTIDKYGAYKVKFQGAATNTVSMEAAKNGSPIPDPMYESKIAGSFFTFTKDGSYELNDGSSKLLQSLKIDKPNGKFTITSGDVSIDIDKNSKKILVTCDSHEIAAKKSIKITSGGSIEMKVTKSIKIDSAKIAIGHGSVELLDSIIKLIDALGAITVNSPVGPCSPLKATPMWQQILILKNKVSTIKGSL